MDLGSQASDSESPWQWTAEPYLSDRDIITRAYEKIPTNSDTCPHCFAFLDWVLGEKEPFWEKNLPVVESDASAADPIEDVTGDTQTAATVVPVSALPQWQVLYNAVRK